MKLEPTYFDAATHRDPTLVKYIQRELMNIKSKGLQGPFGSVDQFQSYFESYLLDLAKELRQRMFDQTGIDIPDIIHTEPYLQLASAREADYLTLINFELYGRKTFFFAGNLVEHLALTELNAPSDFVRPPFACSLFVFRSHLAVDSLYRLLHKSVPDFNSPISTFVIDRPAEEGKRKIVFATFHGNLEHTYSFVKRELLVRDDWTIEKMLRTDWRDLHGEADERYDDNYRHEDDSSFYNEGILFYRILINAMLYLCSNDIDSIESLSPHRSLVEKLRSQRHHQKRRRLEKQMESVSSLDFSLIGSKTQQILVRKPALQSDFDSQQGLRKLAVRFIVRGHWRHQPVGEQGKERKLIWIKPYYKGPEMAELIQKPYVVR